MRAAQTWPKEALNGPLTILFNNILISGRYSTLWSHGLIIPIFKKDDPSNPENYRGITPVSYTHLTLPTSDLV